MKKSLAVAVLMILLIGIAPFASAAVTYHDVITFFSSFVGDYLNFVTGYTVGEDPPITQPDPGVVQPYRDSDGDGIDDSQDNCPNKQNGPNSGTCFGGSNNGQTCNLNQGSLNICPTARWGRKTSMEMVGDVCDNCPTTLMQIRRGDGNSIGDACDLIFKI